MPPEMASAGFDVLPLAFPAGRHLVTTRTKKGSTGKNRSVSPLLRPLGAAVGDAVGGGGGGAVSGLRQAKQTPVSCARTTLKTNGWRWAWRSCIPGLGARFRALAVASFRRSVFLGLRRRAFDAVWRSYRLAKLAFAPLLLNAVTIGFFEGRFAYVSLWPRGCTSL